MLKITQKVRIKNEFTIEVKDARTGEIRKKAQAFNTVLNNGISKMIRGISEGNQNGGHLTKMIRGWTGANFNHQFGAFIHIGTGSGTISPTRTALFNYLASITPVFHATEYNINDRRASYMQRGVILPEQHVGVVITEIGLGSGNASGWASTHALIEDAEGNPINITKTEFDEITIYSKVFMELADPPQNVEYVQGGSGSSNKNFLLHLIAGNMAPHGQFQIQPFAIFVGSNKDALSVTDGAVKTSLGSISLSRTAANRFTPDYANRKITIGPIRFGTSAGNGKIWEVGATITQKEADITPTGEVALPVFRALMPAGNWTGQSFAGRNIGTGTGAVSQFTLPWNDIVPESETVYVDGARQTRGTHYTINNTTGVITFTAAPANGAAITADWQVLYIPKDNQHILDVAYEITFGALT